MKIELNRDWTEFLSALIARQVLFVLVGGHAVAGHGEPRLTEDLDVFVRPDGDNAKRACALPLWISALAKSRPPSQCSQNRTRYSCWERNRGESISSPESMGFPSTKHGRAESRPILRGGPLPVIGKDALLKNKTCCRSAQGSSRRFDARETDDAHCPL